MQHNQSQVDLLKESRDKEIQRQKDLQENMIKVCKQAFAGTNGKYLGKFMKDICLWATPSAENINVDKEVLSYQKGRRDVWMILREFIDKKDLAEIEIYD